MLTPAGLQSTESAIAKQNWNQAGAKEEAGLSKKRKCSRIFNFTTIICIALALALSYRKPSLVRVLSTSNWFIAMASISVYVKKMSGWFCLKVQEPIVQGPPWCNSLQLWRKTPYLPLHTPSTEPLIPLDLYFVQWKLCGTFGKAAPDIEMFSCCSCKGKAVAPVEKSTWGMVIKPTLSLNSRVLGDKFQLGITWTRTNLIWAEVDDSC